MSESNRGPLDAAIALAIRVLSAGLVFGLQVLLARLMPAESYGGYVTVWTWMLALGSFAALGFAESSVRFLPRYHLRGRRAALDAYWRFGFAVVLGTSLVGGLVGAGLALSLGADGVWLTVLLLAIGLPFLGLEYYLEGVARSFGWFRLAAVPVYIIRPLLIGALALGLTAAGVDLDLKLVGIMLVGSMAVVTAGLALVIRQRLARLAPHAGRGSVRQRRLWLHASLPLLLLSGLEDLVSYADVLLLSLLADPEDVGLYFAAARSLALAGFVAYAMTLVSGRRFALDLAGRSRADLQASILEATRLTVWATVGAVVVTVLAGPILLGAFGPAFLDGLPIMWILGAGMVVRALAGQAGEVLVVAGRQREGIAVGFCVLAVMLGSGLVLIPQFGIFGAAWASALAMATRTLVLIAVVRRVERLTVFSVRLPRLSS